MTKQPNIAQYREELLRLLYEKSFSYSDTPIYKLSSGKLSNYYLDCKKVTFSPRGAYLAGEVLFARIGDLSATAVGGILLGAAPLAVAVSLISQIHGRPLSAFVVRKEPKGHGTEALIEGDFHPEARVVVVEDVVTTGESTLKAIVQVTEQRCQVTKVLCLVDRKEGGQQALAAQGLSLESIYTIDDFLKLHQARVRL